MTRVTRLPLLVLGCLTALVLPLAAAAVARPATGAYHNPLAPRISGGGTVDSCADPSVLRGRGNEARSWYLYCTTDPLNDQGTTDPAHPDFRVLPTMRSTDLTHWKYVGEALPEKPSWADPSAFLWAPDVVYSHRYDRYYLSFVVTDTADAVSGEPGCHGDNAIGVATSDSPTGPWKVADAPLVAPRRAGPGCNFYWTYDPDVLGDSIDTSSVLYYGSYYGGVWAQDVTLTPDGMSTTASPERVTAGTDTEPAVDPADERTGAVDAAADPTPIAIPNRYEGTNVVRHGGWYYLFGSATNCCNGSLTGYSVFAGRSRDPKGPFVDKEGRSLLAGRVGGTPVISMNGNRWVGTGHSSAFRDFGGQWWMAYHAVDRDHPYFAGAPGFTKRPALLDPVDWVHGWPSVRSGRWASDRRMPAPAAQPGERTRYKPRPVAPQRLGRRLDRYSDSFGGTSLDPRWSWVRQPDPTTYGVSGGRFRFDTQYADLHVDSNDASVLTEQAPKGDYVVQTKVGLDVPAEGCCHNYAQAGLVIYGSDDAFLKLVHASLWETRQTEWATEQPTVPHWEGTVPADKENLRYGNTVVGPPGDDTWLRIVKDRDHYTAYTSDDGRHWVRGGVWVNDTVGARPRIGLVSMGCVHTTDDALGCANPYHAAFDHVRVWKLRH